MFASISVACLISLFFFTGLAGCLAGLPDHVERKGRNWLILIDSITCMDIKWIRKRRDRLERTIGTNMREKFPNVFEPKLADLPPYRV